MKNTCENRTDRRRGIALILLSAMLLTVMIPLVGLAIDGSMLYLVKTRLSTAVDGGTIAAARSLSAGMNFADQQEAAVKTAEQFVRSNFPAGYWGAREVVFDEPVDVREDMTTNIKRRTVEIKASVEVPLLFMRVLGKESTTVRASGMAARRDVRLVLVLDRSASMSAEIGALRNAATEFVSRFAEGRDQVGLVVYGTTAIVAFPPRDPANPTGGTGPANNFKSATPSVSRLIGETASCCGTGMAEAMYLAWQELKKNPLEGALNIIVLFTDGMPSAVTIYANNPEENVMKSTSPCVNKDVENPAASQKIIGALTLTSSSGGGSAYYSGSGVRGFYRVMQTTQNGSAPDVERWVKLTGDEGGYGSGAGKATEGCSVVYSPNASPVSNDLSALPTKDAYGNATNVAAVNQAYYYSQGGAQYLSQVTKNYQTYLASWSAADDVARRIRTDSSLDVVVYTIGLGSDSQVDSVLMKRMANVNDVANTSYDSTNPPGLYVKAPTTSELAAAFGKVASEILRLTN